MTALGPARRGPGKVDRTVGPAWARFAQNLKLLMALRQVDERHIEARMGRGRRTVRRWLTCAVAPHIDDVAQLARILSVDPGVLAFGQVRAASCEPHAKREED